MSDEPEAPSPDRQRPDRTVAAVRRSWWPGWIWGIPLAAILVLGWWVFRWLAAGGQDVTIRFDDVHGLKPNNADVVYRGLAVGSVGDMALTPDGRAIDVTVHIRDPATRFLTTGTRFWLQGANPSLSNLGSLGAVLSGPTVVMEPGPGRPARHFVGLTHKPVAGGGHGPAKLYRVWADGAVGEVKAGDPVTLRGFPVGEIRDVGFQYDARTGRLSTPLTLALYPSLFHIEGTAKPQSQDALAAAVRQLVGEGLRARVGRSPPFIGSAQVTLAMDPGAPPAQVTTKDGLPEIPAAGPGGLDTLIRRVGRLPVDQIADNLLATSRRIRSLVSSPRLADALGQLDATLAQLHATVAQVHATIGRAGPEIPALVAQLRQAAARVDQAARSAQHTMTQAQGTIRAARRMVGGPSSQAGMQSAMREITDAARSVRELANYLNQHPEAIIQGRR